MIDKISQNMKDWDIFNGVDKLYIIKSIIYPVFVYNLSACFICKEIYNKDIIKKGGFFMKKKQLLSAALVATMVVTAFAGCGKDSDEGSKDTANPVATEAPDSGDGADTETPKEIKEFTAFFAVPPTVEVDDNNDIKNLIAEKTGVKVKETWLVGQNDKEAIGTMIASDEYDDFIEGAAGQPMLYEAGALIPLDDLIEKNPNVKSLFSDADWDALRQDDGHIYWIPQFGSIQGEEKVSNHNDEALWVQARVLKWAGYPKIETLDEYFDLLEKYMAEDIRINNIENIGFTMLCTKDRNFSLENPPCFLAGYPNDGCALVDPVTQKVTDYNTNDFANRYFKKINEEFKKGIIDKECFTQTFDEYIAKLSSGNVLGLVDQWWSFSYSVDPVLKTTGLDAQGCNYIPLPIVMDKGIEPQWHTVGSPLNVSSGLAISKDCEDPEAAMKFVNDLLDQEIHDLRYWGIKDVDYSVDENGNFYRTEEQRVKAADTVNRTAHLCPYSYFPQWQGTSTDGINATKPENQPGEFFDALNPVVQECLQAYGAQTYVDLMGITEKPGPWYPMWTFSNSFTTDTPGGTAWLRMKEVRLEWLPKVIMADDFDSEWAAYMEAYAATNPQSFIDEIQAEVNRRVENAARFE